MHLYGRQYSRSNLDQVLIHIIDHTEKIDVV